MFSFNMFTFCPPPGPVISVPFHSTPKPQLVIVMSCLEADWYSLFILLTSVPIVTTCIVISLLSLRISEGSISVRAWLQESSCKASAIRLASLICSGIYSSTGIIPSSIILVFNSFRAPFGEITYAVVLYGYQGLSSLLDTFIVFSGSFSLRCRYNKSQ